MSNNEAVRCKTEFNWIAKEEPADTDSKSRRVPLSAQSARKRDFDCLSDEEDPRRPKKLSVRSDLQGSDESSDSDYETDRHAYADNVRRYMELLTQMARIQELQHGAAPPVMPWPWIIPSMPRMFQVPGMFAPCLMYPSSVPGAGLPWAQEAPKRPAMTSSRNPVKVTSPPAKVRKFEAADLRRIAPAVPKPSPEARSPATPARQSNVQDRKPIHPNTNFRQSGEGERVLAKANPVKKVSVSVVPPKDGYCPKYDVPYAPRRPKTELESQEEHVERNYECGQCKMRTRSHHGLKRHLHSHGDHLPAKPAVCSKCRQQFLNVFDLYFHVLSHEKGDISNNSDSEDAQEAPSAAEDIEEPFVTASSGKLFPRYFECGECGLRVRSHYGLGRHFKKHVSVGPLPAVCSVCRLAFPNTIQLQEHIMTHPEAATNLNHRRPAY